MSGGCKSESAPPAATVQRQLFTRFILGVGRVRSADPTMMYA